MKDITEFHIALQAVKAGLWDSRKEFLTEQDEQLIKKLRDNTFACSFSSNPNCGYLSNYYAEKNSGVVLEFSYKGSYRSDTAVFDCEDSFAQEARLIKVLYEPAPYFKNKCFDFGSLYWNTLFYKTKEFIVENEYRVYYHPANDLSINISQLSAARERLIVREYYDIEEHLEFDSNKHEMYLFFGSSGSRANLFTLTGIKILKNCELSEKAVIDFLSQNNFNGVQIL